MKSLKTYINEAIVTEASKGYKVSDKDWKRMADLINTGSFGESVASKIKDKYKAAARFVAGCKLRGDVPSKIYNSTYKYETFNKFGCFGNKALDLGATTEEINKLYEETEIPVSFKEQYHPKAPGIEGVINKLKNDGFKVTSTYTKASPVGLEQMQRNGRAWSIAKIYTIEKDNKTLKIFFDDITCEGVNSPSYGYVTPYTHSRMYTAFKDAKKEFLEEVNKKFGTSY